MINDPWTVTAEQVLDGMEEIVRNEMVDHVGYVSRVVRPDLEEQGSVCRGRQACTVGSAYLTAGVRVEVHPYDDALSSLPGTEMDHEQRLEWLEGMGYGGLLRAYLALCESSQEYLDEHGLELDRGLHRAGPLEGLFESYDCDEFHYLIEPRQLVDVIVRARELLL